MTIETAEKVSKLLKEKISFEKEYAELLSENNKFKIGYAFKNSIMYCSIFEIGSNLSIEFKSKIKNLVIEELQNNINRIEKEIEILKC